MVQTAPSINLFRKTRRSFLDKFITWALTAGRLLVIVTEIIALSAFLYRFSLDRKLIDLRDQIKYKEAVVKQLKTQEDKFRNLQERLGLTSELGKMESSPVSYLADITALASEGMLLTNLRITEELIKIDAVFQSVSTLRNFVQELKRHPKIKGVSVDKVENKTSSATIVVSITAQLKSATKNTKTINK